MFSLTLLYKKSYCMVTEIAWVQVFRKTVLTQYMHSTGGVWSPCGTAYAFLFAAAWRSTNDLHSVLIIFSSHVVAMCACCISFIRPHPMEGLCICIGWLQLSNELCVLTKKLNSTVDIAWNRLLCEAGAHCLGHQYSYLCFGLRFICCIVFEHLFCYGITNMRVINFMDYTVTYIYILLIKMPL